MNFVKVAVIGKRELRLVVSAKYECYTYDKRTAQILDNEIFKGKSRFVTLELQYQKKGRYRKFPSFLVNTV